VLTFFIFSKDRPLQLHALLSSIVSYCSPLPSVLVLYRASNDKFRRCYGEVFKELSGRLDVLAVHEDYSFADHVRLMVDFIATPTIAFLVDDIVFIRPFDFKDLLPWSKRGYIPSLRLGFQTTYSYMTDSTQKLPPFRKKGGFLTWSWGQGGLDWSYPLSVDGNLFDRQEIRRLLTQIKFHSPNTLEQSLQKFNPVFRRKTGICFFNPVLLNIPCNKVQSDFVGNRSGELDTHQLVKVWESGKRIYFEAFRDISTNSVHVELPLTFVPREAAW